MLVRCEARLRQQREHRLVITSTRITVKCILTLPRQLDGSPGGAVFQVVHRDPDATLYWHLDDTYLGETRLIHQMKLSPSPGKHTVTVVDGDGNSVSVGFTVAK